jgi:hypothetical protein
LNGVTTEPSNSALDSDPADATPHAEVAEGNSTPSAIPEIAIPLSIIPSASLDASLGRWEAFRRDITPVLSEIIKPHWLSLLVPFLLILVYTYVSVREEWFYLGSPVLFQAFVPVLALWIAWRRRMEVVRQYYELAFVFAEDSPKRRGKIWLIPLAALTMLAGCLLEIRAFTVIGFILTIIGGIYYLFGPFIVRSLWHPLTFLVTMIPLPTTTLLKVANIFQKGVSFLTNFVFQQFDKSAELREMPGRNVIHLSSHDIVMTTGLSGVTIAIPVVILTIWYALVRRFNVLLSLALVAIGFTLAILVTILRLILFGVLTVENPHPWLVEVLNWGMIGLCFFGMTRAAAIMTARRTIVEEQPVEATAEADLEAILRGDVDMNDLLEGTTSSSEKSAEKDAGGR